MLGKIVILKQEHVKILNPDMKEFIIKNKDRRFYVEQVCETSAKLKGLYFWITFDLLEVVS